jgi:hypothetical protein
MGVSVNDNLINPGGHEQEGPFHTDSIGGSPPNSKISVIPAFAGSDHCSFEFLYTFPVTLFNSNMDTDLVARFQSGDIGILIRIEFFI